jgi:hypothetical protein
MFDSLCRRDAIFRAHLPGYREADVSLSVPPAVTTLTLLPLHEMPVGAGSYRGPCKTPSRDGTLPIESGVSAAGHARGGAVMGLGLTTLAWKGRFGSNHINFPANDSRLISKLGKNKVRLRGSWRFCPPAPTPPFLLSGPTSLSKTTSLLFSPAPPIGLASASLARSATVAALVCRYAHARESCRLANHRR